MDCQSCAHVTSARSGRQQGRCSEERRLAAAAAHFACSPIISHKSEHTSTPTRQKRVGEPFARVANPHLDLILEKQQLGRHSVEVSRDQLRYAHRRPHLTQRAFCTLFVAEPQPLLTLQ